MSQHCAIRWLRVISVVWVLLLFYLELTGWSAGRVKAGSVPRVGAAGTLLQGTRVILTHAHISAFLHTDQIFKYFICGQMHMLDSGC